jgi:AraC-like DNA-binding protein
MVDRQAPPSAAETYNATDLAHWGLLELVRREQIRDRMMAAIAEPSSAVLAVLRQQSDADETALIRRWRWQQWCQQHGAAKVASHFLAHLAEPLDLADLAEAVNLSPRRLLEICRQRHCCTPMDLLRQQRLALLAQQLRDPQLAGRSLGGLLAGLQLSDSASTRQAFARLYGCSPADYRRGGRAGVPV